MITRDAGEKGGSRGEENRKRETNECEQGGRGTGEVKQGGVELGEEEKATFGRCGMENGSRRKTQIVSLSYGDTPLEKQSPRK